VVDVERHAMVATSVGDLLAVVTLRGAAGDALGQAVVTAGNESSTIAISTPDGAPLQAATTEQLLDAALAEVIALGGGEVHWWISDATSDDEAVAAATGLDPGRRLLQMGRGLPIGRPIEISTRPFRPGEDDSAWLAVNNRAFAGHPEQGAWTVRTLAQREAEPWFDPQGCLLHERDGRLAGFCWTRLHDIATPEVVGEIYVIAVDPDFHGLGLGSQLTLAGLASIFERGVADAMLYVDAANLQAVRMYERLGFTTRRVDQAYTSVLTARR